MLEAVRGDGNALEYASKNLKADREVVLEAIELDRCEREFIDVLSLDYTKRLLGLNGEFIDEDEVSVRIDINILQTAIGSSDRGALQYADKNLQND